jgi:hypothetical protein
MMSQQPTQPPPYGPGGYGQPAPQSNTVAIAALVVGIIAVLASITIVGGFVLGLVAVVLGAIGVSKAGQLRSGKGQAVAGIVLGIVAMVLSVLLVAFGLFVTQTFIEQAPLQLEDLELPVEGGG